MTWQATLPLSSLAGTDALSPFGAVLEADASPSSITGASYPDSTFGGSSRLHRPRLEVQELKAKGVLRRSTRMGGCHGWEIDPYRGCELAPAYRTASAEGGSGGRSLLFPWAASKDAAGEEAASARELRKIQVFKDAGALLRRELQRLGRSNGAGAGSAIALGSGLSVHPVADPYQPAESHYKITRSILEALRDSKGMEVSITTRSPLILRDLALLTELDARHTVSINVAVPTASSALCRRLEPYAPDPEARLRAVAGLAREGLAVSVDASPLMPGINDGREALKPLFEEAKLAGAVDVTAQVLDLKSLDRKAFFAWLEGEFPELVSRYRQSFGWRDTLQPRRRELTETTFRHLRLVHGFPHAAPSRG